MSDNPNPIMPDAHPGTDDVQVHKDPAVRAGQPVILPEWTKPTPIRWALKRWLRDTVVSIALALFPLMVLGIISWFPAVGQSAALRVVPLVALVLYLPWLSWDVLRAAWGRPPRDPFVRHSMRRRSYYDFEPYLGRLVVRLLVALFCLPAVAVLALRVLLPGWLMASLAVLPILVYVISVGLAGYVEGISVLCFSMESPLLDRFRSGDESEPNRP